MQTKVKLEINPEEENSGFVLDGANRREAYENHIAFEKGFEDPDARCIMSFRKFCAELNKGYGKSDYGQIARLFEAPDGRIWYDTSWAGN